MRSRPPAFFARDVGALDEFLRAAKLTACPHCGRSGTLVGHGLLVGYAEATSARVVRGRRLLCSARHRRPGCGRTFSVRLAGVLAGFSVRTRALSRLVEQVVGGLSRKAAWERAEGGLHLRSGYRLWRRLLAAQPLLRTALTDRCPAPPCADRRPIAQLHAHLQHAFPDAACVMASFQHALQRHLLR